MSFRLLPQAIDDIETLADHIEQDSPKAARRWVDALQLRCAALGAMPGMGVPRPDIAEGVRIFPHGNYLIIYIERGSQVDIVRVIHGMRNADNWLA